MRTVAFRRLEGYLQQMKKAIAILGLLFAATTQAQERIMFPVLSKTLPGANGALWRTRLLVHNAGPQEASLEPMIDCPVAACPNLVPVLPGYTREVIWPFSEGRTVDIGRFVTVVYGDPSRLSFHLVAEDTTRLSLTAGTELPVVRENAFRDKPIRFIGLLSDPNFRHNMRIYTNGTDTPVTLRTFARNTSGPIGAPGASRSVSLTRPTIPEAPYFFPSAELNIDDMLPTSGQEYIVEIEAPAGSKLWAFISVTNNATQHITTITPQ